MGSEEPGFEEGPAGPVFVSEFWCAGAATSNHEFQAFVDATGYRTTAEQQHSEVCWRDYAGAHRAEHPVVMMSWHDAQAYAAWLSELTGLSYRLPTEAEWEKAARGGREHAAYAWGNLDPVEAGANFGALATGEAPSTVAVHALPRNDLGMSIGGNVWEWAADWYDPDCYSTSLRSDPTGPSHGEFRVRRGGAFNNRRAFRLRVSSRNRLQPESTFANMGFRLVCTGDLESLRARTVPRLRVVSDIDERPSPASEQAWDMSIRSALAHKQDRVARVEAVLDVLRPSMEEDHGGVRVVEVVDGCATLEMQGTCRSCPKSQLTFSDLAATLHKHLPELHTVRRVGN